jgi:multidrug efflux pump subunit AcrA (membrane-fusion protein)
MKLVSILLLTVLVASGCSTPPGSAANVSKNNEPGLRRVNTAVAMEKPLDQLVVVTGTLAAEQEITLGLKVAGRISDLMVDLGSTVRQGDVVARLDTTDFTLRVRQSEAALQQARVRLGLPPYGKQRRRQYRANRSGPLLPVRRWIPPVPAWSARSSFPRTVSWRKRISTPSMAPIKLQEAEYADSLDEAKNRQGVLAQRRSELEIARQQLNDAVLYAPITGAVRQRNANVGEYLASGAPVVTLVQMNPLRLKTEVPERDALQIRNGMMVRVSVDGAAGTHEGRVVRLSPTIDETSRTLLVETEVANANNVLRPGAFARAEIIVSSRQRALIVPAAALATFAGIDRVFVVQEGKVAEKRVRTGRRSEAGVEVLEGITAGDVVVIEPGSITDGEKVAIAGSK